MVGQVDGDIYFALSAPARRAILDALAKSDGQTLFEICTRITAAEGLAMSRQAVSQHLDVLEAAGLVSTKREGRYKYHDFDPAPLAAIAARWAPHESDDREDPT